MIRYIAKPALIGAATLTMLFTTSTASADYRVTAFGEAAGYHALVSMDAESALSVLDSQSRNFDEVNNLCVANILSEDYQTAIATCELALEKLQRELSLTFSVEKSAMASIYSNLGVAKALAGDIDGAGRDLEMALSLNSRDRNAVNNLQVVTAKRAPADIAGNL